MWIQCGQLRGIDSLDLLKAPRTGCWIGALVQHDPLAQRVAGNDASGLSSFASALTFVSQKEKHPVFFDRPTRAPSERVAQQRSRLIRFAVRQFRVLIKPIVGHQVFWAIVFISRAVHLIRTALGNDGNLRT